MRITLNSIFRIIKWIIIFFLSAVIGLNLGKLIAWLIWQFLSEFNLIEPIGNFMSKFIL